MAGYMLKNVLLAVLVLMQITSLVLSEETGRVKRADAKRKVRVVSVVNIPYTMEAPEGTPAIFNTSQGKGYTGFIPDLLKSMAMELNLEIEFYIEPNGRYGAYNKDTNTWSGMVGEVLKRETKGPGEGADIAAAALTMTSGREKVVNFVKGFQHHGLTMLVKRPEVDPARSMWEYTFDVVKPLAGEVWAACTIGVLVVGILLWGNNRFNPYEWGGRHEIGRASEAAAESFNLQGSLWFAFTSLQWQGFDRAPRSISAKTLTCFWFTFVTLTLVTYTGSLVNHLFWASTVHGKNPMQSPIQSLGDLVSQDKIDYGFIQGGSTQRYFTDVASGPIYDKMRSYWNSKGSTVHVKSTKEGIQRVRDGNYVFIMEKYSAEYHANTQPCNLMTTGELIGHRSYGFAIPHNMDQQLSEDLHRVILEMFEEGDIEALEKKWWLAKGECWSQKRAERKAAEASALYINKPKQVDMQMFWGPVVLLTVGVVLTIVITIVEIIFYKYKGRYQRDNRPGDSKLQMDDDATA